MKQGDQLGKYRLERELGAGGMGAVWLAHDTELDRKVALKVLRPALAGDDTAQARLLREARAMAKLRHPNVITVFDAETIAGRDLVAMELVDGENMATWLASERTEHEILGALIAAGRGLAAAHAAGMVHRDFKPHNVLVERAGRVLVTDFGLARADGGSADPHADTAAETPRTAPALALALEETAATAPSGVEVTASLPRTGGGGSGRGALDSDLTRTGTLLGTPAYMAPEQLRGAPADARADQFAFCVTVWEALAGKRPFPGEDVAAISKAIERGEPVFADRVPRRLRPLLARGLAKDPAARWPAMAPLLDALERAWKRPKKVRDWSMAIGLGVVTFVAIFVVMAFVGSDGRKAGATCRAADALAGVWSPDVRGRLVGLVGDPKARALGLIDHWASDWSAAYDANCGKPQDDDFAARKLCLEAQRDSVSLLVSPRDAADAKALAQSDVAVMLPDPVSCVRAPRVIAPPLPKDPALRGRIQDMRTLLIILRGKLLSGEPVTDDVLARAKDTIAALETSEDAAARAGAVSLKSMVIAFNAQNQRDPKAIAQVYALMKQAADLSEAAGEDRTRVQMVLGMTEMVSYMPGFWADLDDLLHRGEAGVQHIKDPVAELILTEVHARIAHVRGRWSEAIDAFEQARQGWLARGSGEVYARFTIELAIDLLNRHAPGDLDRGLAVLREAGTHEMRPTTRKNLESTTDAVRELLAQADDAALNRLGYTRDAATGTGTLVATVAGLAPPTLKDDDAPRGQRTGIPEIMVRQGTLSWRVPVGADGRFTLTRLAAGRYQVEAFVNSALGDLQMVHADADVAAGSTAAVTVTYPTPHAEKRTVGPTTGQGFWGIAVALPGKASPATAGELRAALTKAPWWSVVTVHGVQEGPAAVLEAELGAFSTPVTVCPIAGAYNDGSSPELFLGSDARPVHCD